MKEQLGRVCAGQGHWTQCVAPFMFQDATAALHHIGRIPKNGWKKLHLVENGF